MSLVMVATAFVVIVSSVWMAWPVLFDKEKKLGKERDPFDKELEHWFELQDMERERLERLKEDEVKR